MKLNGVGVGETAQEGWACAKVARAVRGARAHVMAGWGIVDKQASTHMHADTVVCVRVHARTLVQQEMRNSTMWARGHKGAGVHAHLRNNGMGRCV